MLPDEAPGAVPHEALHVSGAPVGALPRALFDGPGEMRTRCRAFDWAATPVGPVADWPASLQFLVELLLAARQPMFLWWGPALTQFYNDGYRPSLGADRHPAALGAAGRAFWADAWPIIGPEIEAILHGGPATWHEDHLVPIVRDGQLQDVYWTYGYTPVRDEAGDVGGVLVTVIETTAQVLGRAAQAEREQLEVRLSGALLDAAVLLNQMSDGHLVLDPAFRIVRVNPSAERALGRSRTTLLGQTHWEAFPASVGTEVERQYRRVAAEGVETHFNHHYVGEGYDFHLEIDAYPAHGGGVAVFWREISARVRMLAENEAARLEAEERVATLAAVLNNIPDALLVMRLGEITRANRVALDHLGVTSVEALQAPAPGEALPLEEVFVHPTSGTVLPLAATPIGRAFAGERSHAHVLLRALGRDATRPVRAAAAPILTEGGEVLGVVAVLTDMTRHHQANAERDRLLAESEAARRDAEASFTQAQAAFAEARAAYAELQVASRAKTDFLAVMSHELRTPLNAIGGYAELLELGLHGPVTPEQRNALDRIQRSQRHLLGLMNGVLNYSKIEAGAVHYEVANVSLPAVLAECETLVGPQARAKGLTLQHDTCAEPLSARADGEKVRQVVLNLLSNAVKFTPSGGRVSLECMAHGDGTVAVRVADTGRGIVPDQLERVFQPLVQLDASLTRTHEGTGLGLAISRDLARGMGGDLTVTSEDGVGSTFTLTLPQA